MSTATLEEIAELRRLCTDYDLDGRQILDGYLNSELTHIYNGAGPDSWHDWSRKTLTAVMTSVSACGSDSRCAVPRVGRNTRNF